MVKKFLHFLIDITLCFMQVNTDKTLKYIVEVKWDYLFILFQATYIHACVIFLLYFSKLL